MLAILRKSFRMYDRSELVDIGVNAMIGKVSVFVFVFLFVARFLAQELVAAHFRSHLWKTQKLELGRRGRLDRHSESNQMPLFGEAMRNYFGNDRVCECLGHPSGDRSSCSTSWQ